MVPLYNLKSEVEHDILSGQENLFYNNSGDRGCVNGHDAAHGRHVET